MAAGTRHDLYLNHGTVGVTPLAVMQAQAALRERIEPQPARCMRRALKTARRAVADSVAATADAGWPDG